MKLIEIGVKIAVIIIRKINILFHATLKGCDGRRGFYTLYIKLVFLLTRCPLPFTFAKFRNGLKGSSPFTAPKAFILLFSQCKIPIKYTANKTLLNFR